jgi:hypothetical protein
MAKKKRTGSVISVRRLSGRGLGKISNPSSGMGAVVPPLLGGGLAGAATVLIEHMATPTNGTAPSATMATMGEYAPYIGVGVGALGAAALYAVVGAPQGAAAAAGAFGVGGSLVAYKLLNQEKAAAGVVPPAVATSGRRMGRSLYGRRSTGAIVMEPVATRGTGAIVPQIQPQGMAGTGDPRGETVALGAVSPSAFGTPGFAV